MYEVIYMFMDLQDNDHVYAVGDKYPREGYEPTLARIRELSGEENKIGKQLIKEIKVETKKTTKKKEIAKEAPVEEVSE